MTLKNPFKRQKNKANNNTITVKYSKLDNIGKVKQYQIPDKNEIDNSINSLTTEVNNSTNLVNQQKTRLDKVFSEVKVFYTEERYSKDFSDCLEVVDFNNDYVAVKFKLRYDNDKLVQVTGINSLVGYQWYFQTVHIHSFTITRPGAGGGTAIKVSPLLLESGAYQPTAHGVGSFTINKYNQNILTILKKSEIDYSPAKTQVNALLKWTWIGVLA